MHHKCLKCESKFARADLTPAIPDLHEEASGDLFLCHPCREATYFKCTHCSKEKLREGDLAPAEHPRGGPLCEYCFYTQFKQCKSCNCMRAVGDGVVTSSNNFFCHACAVDRFFSCSYCSQKREMDHLWNRTSEGPVCNNCRHSYEAEQNPRPIENYSFKPRPKFRGKGHNKLFFGFELEVEKKREVSDETLNAAAKAVSDAVTDERGRILYCKHDGSISNGFEIVSHPFDWYWFLKNRDKFDPIFGLVKKGYNSHDNGRCGMHVHLSKDAFTTMHLYKFISFFQREKEFILRISQRGTEAKALDGYAKIDYEGGSVKKIAKDKGGHAGRYQAVNLQPPKTVEIRIFRGTLKKERFMKNLEFCRALYEFTLINTLSNCKMEYFIGFVHRYKSEFPNLYSFLEERYKFKILKKGSKEAIRYSGAKAVTPGQTDVGDTEWDAEALRRAAARRAEIEARIKEAKSKKAASR